MTIFTLFLLRVAMSLSSEENGLVPNSPLNTRSGRNFSIRTVTDFSGSSAPA
jgi:hypothetical protein